MGLYLHVEGNEDLWFQRLPDDPLDLLWEPDSEEPIVPMPTVEDFGSPGYEDIGGYLEWELRHPEKVVALDVAVTAYFRQPTNGRIPIFKFSSNDDWYVTPDEMRRTLDHIDGQGPDLKERLLVAFVDWPYGSLDAQENTQRFFAYVEFLRATLETGFLVG